MASAIHNCKKCGGIFEKRLSDLCAPCIKQEEEQFRVLYRTLQQSAAQGGIAIGDLAAEVGISTEDIERFYREGRLSTAGVYLKMPCQNCETLMRDVDRRGRFCVRCSELAATKAGVEVKSVQALERSEDQERKRQQQLALLRQNRPSAKPARKFGSEQSRR